MNGIEKIVDRILSDNADEIRSIEQMADERCREIETDYQHRSDEEYKRLIEAGKKAADERYDRIKSAAEMEAKKTILAEKQAVLGETFAYAAKLLTELPDENYARLLAALCSRASKTGDETVLLNERDLARVGKDVVEKANDALAAAGKPANLSLGTATRNILGGAVLVSGNIETNCSLEALTEEYRPELTPQIAEILF